MFKKTNAIQSTEQILETATSTLTGDINGLFAKRESALSAFRKTAVDLDNVNCGLRAKIDNLKTLTAFIEEQSGAVTQMIDDNDKVRTRILEIIGG